MNDESLFIENKNSTIAASEIAGIPRRKEYFAASFLSHPERRAVDIVIPDLDTPGITANAWEIPINKLSINLWFLMFIHLFFEISEIYIKNAINSEIMAIERLDRRILSKKLGKKIFMRLPKRIKGTVPIKIEFKSLLLKKDLICKFCFLLFNLKISSLKYQNIANTLPIWIIADKEGPGSSIPKKRDITFKWAVLLTGINSVEPWINPYKINFKYSKN